MKRLCKDAEIEGQFTNHTLCTTTAPRALKKAKFVIQCSRHRDVTSLQKYQCLETSIKIEFSKAFNIGEAVSLSDSTGSEKAPLKREVELQEETTWKFSKGCDEAGITETKPVTFNQCNFTILKDWKLFGYFLSTLFVVKYICRWHYCRKFRPKFVKRKTLIFSGRARFN